MFVGAVDKLGYPKSGKLTYFNGNIFEGGFVDGRPYGRCKGSFKNGSITFDAMINDKGRPMHGTLNYFHEVEGQLVINKTFEGELDSHYGPQNGRLSLADGTTLSGAFLGGNLHGPGTSILSKENTN